MSLAIDTRSRGLGLARSRVEGYVLASLFAALTAVGAFIRVPFGVVHFTLQDFFVMLSGCLLGPAYGALSQLIYLGVGLVGVPIFSQGGGPGYVLQPTFGYLLGYPVAAWVIGVLVWSRRSVAVGPPGVVRLLAGCAAGSAMIFLFGVAGLYFNLNFVAGKETLLGRALQVGLVVFIPATVLKVIAGSLISARLVAALGARS